MVRPEMCGRRQHGNVTWNVDLERRQDCQVAIPWVSTVVAYVIKGQQTLRAQAKGVGNAVESGEQGDDMDCFCRLKLAPAGLFQPGDIFDCNLVRAEVYLARKTEECLLGLGKSWRIKVETLDGAEGVCRAAVDTQEIAMAVGAIGAVVLGGDEGRDHFFVAPDQTAIREDEALG